jgi:hypothetical protein
MLFKMVVRTFTCSLTSYRPECLSRVGARVSKAGAPSSLFLSLRCGHNGMVGSYAFPQSDKKVGLDRLLYWIVKSKQTEPWTNEQ